MTKRNYCKICGEYCAKRKTCLNCKLRFPMRTAGKEGRPFNRKDEYEKEKKKKARD